MADKNISSLPKATTLDDDSLLIVEQQGQAVSVSGQLIKEYAAGGVTNMVNEATAAANEAMKAVEEVKTVVEDAESIAEEVQAAQTAASDASAAQSAAEAAQAAAEQARNEAQAIAGGDFLPLAGGTMTGPITLSGEPDADRHAATKKYVDNSMSSAMPRDTYDPQGKAEDVFAYIDSAVSAIKTGSPAWNLVGKTSFLASNSVTSDPDSTFSFELDTPFSIAEVNEILVICTSAKNETSDPVECVLHSQDNVAIPGAIVAAPSGSVYKTWVTSIKAESGLWLGHLNAFSSLASSVAETFRSTAVSDDVSVSKIKLVSTGEAATGGLGGLIYVLVR